MTGVNHLVPYGRSQQTSPGTLVSLFDINMTEVGGGIYHFTPGLLGSAKVKWQGTTYEPLPITASGFEKNGRGEQPTPTLSMPATELIIASVIALDDLRRARVTRWQVYEDNLDNGAQPTASYYPPEIYMIQRKTRHNTSSGIIEWELSTGLDLWGDLVPRRPATQKVCMWRYRLWNGSRLDYTSATCPYAGSSMFDEDGRRVVDPRLDKCGKHLEDCELRFGTNSPLPFGAFPGIGASR
jgi:lambda family phage minor tail protein L